MHSGILSPLHNMQQIIFCVNQIKLPKTMTMEYHLEQYRSMVDHCNDGNNVPIRIGPHEQKYFTIDNTDTLHGAIQVFHKPGGQLKVQVMLRAYRVYLTERLINYHGVKVVHTRDVDRALRMSKYDLDKSYEFAVKNIFSDLKIIMDEHRQNTSNMRDCRRKFRQLELVIRVERSLARKDRNKLLNCLREIDVEKEKLDLVSKKYQVSYVKANGAVLKQLHQFEKDLKVKGKTGVTRTQLRHCLKQSKYDCGKAFAQAMSIN